MERREVRILKHIMGPIPIMVLSLVFLLASCSSSTDLPLLCRVSVGLPQSRAVTANTDPLSDYDIYYQAIYKGSGESYGNMTGFSLLGGVGFLVSQGLWEIKVEFRKDGYEAITYSSL